MKGNPNYCKGVFFWIRTTSASYFYSKTRKSPLLTCKALFLCIVCVFLELFFRFSWMSISKWRRRIWDTVSSWHPVPICLDVSYFNLSLEKYQGNCKQSSAFLCRALRLVLWGHHRYSFFRIAWWLCLLECSFSASFKLYPSSQYFQRLWICSR